MINFFDSNALLKIVIDEPDSSIARNLFSESSEIIISPVTEVEFHSALCRKNREGIITDIEVENAIEWLSINLSLFRIPELDSFLKDASIRVVQKFQLRTLDSIQLASALNEKYRLDGFLSWDKKLIEAAKNADLPVIKLTA